MRTVRTHFNLSPEEYERSREGHQNRRRAEIIEVPLRSHSEIRSVLEVGCGTGLLLSGLAERYPTVQFVGTDIETKMVDYAQATHVRDNLSFACRDITVDGPGATFDYVFSIDMVHHLHDHEAGFRSIRSALSEGGCWLAIEPNIRNPYIYLQQERMRRAGFDEDHFRLRRLRPFLDAAGLRLVRKRFAFIVPAAFAEVPTAVAVAERALERVPVFGGSVVCTYQAV